MRTLMKIITYALIANVFFFLCEIFTVFYSGIPEHMDHIIYLFAGHDGHGVLVPWMWTSMTLMTGAIILLLIPKIRNNEKAMPFLCIMVFTVLATLTWFHCHAFKNSESLWVDTLAKNPKAWMAHNNLGLIYTDKELVKNALKH